MILFPRILSMATLVGLLLWGSPAFASGEAGAMSAAQALEESRGAERLWSRAWGYTWAGATAVQLALIPVLDDDETTIDLAFGAGGAALGLIPTFIYGPWVLRASEAELADPVAALARDRADKAARRAWYNHAGNVAVNLGLGAGLGFGYGHWVSALLTVATGIPIGEVMILTQPGPRHGGESASARPFFGPGFGGVSLAYSW